MPRLINCLQEVKAKVDSDVINPKTNKPKQVDVFDHETKRGMIAEASKKVRDTQMSVNEAEIETVRELRDKALAAAEQVEASLAATPRAQLAAPRRPVDRDVKTAQAFARMHANPEKAFILAQRIMQEFQRVRAETQSLLAGIAPGEKDTIKEQRKIRAFAELDALVSALPPEIRGEIFGETKTLAELRATDASIGNFLVQKIDSIDRALQKHFKAMFLKQFNDLIAAKKARKTAAGVRKSKVGADAQDVVDHAAVYSAMTEAAVAKRYNEIESSLLAGNLEPEEESKLLIEQHELSIYGAAKAMSAGQLETALAELRATVRAGQAAWGALEEARLNDQRAKSANLVSVLPPGTESGATEQNKHKLRNWLRDYARTHTSFVQILERLFPGSSFIGDWVTRAIKADQSDQAYVRKMNDAFYQALSAAVGSKLPWKVGTAVEAMRDATIPVPDGGKASKGEAIHFLFMWAQPKIQESMRLDGWTDAHILALRDATSDPVSQAAMAFMRTGYEQIYRDTDPVHVGQYGMHLTRVEGQYAPVRRRAAGAITHMTPTGLGSSTGITPSSLKARVDNKQALLQVDAMDVFREHLMQMSHWIHFAPLIRETRGVLGNAKVKQALENQIGRDGVGDLQKQLDAITRGGVARSMDVSATNSMIKHITRGAATVGLAFNMYTGAIQLDSAFRWMPAIPMQRWGQALLLHQWLPKISKMWHSDAVQNRVREGMNPQMQAGMASSKMIPSTAVLSAHLGFIHLRYLDGILTSISAAIVYTDAINQGMTQEQALDLMSAAVGRFAQPTQSVAKAMQLLTGNSFSQSMFMFMADPVLKTALIAEGAMNVGRGVKTKDLALVEKGARSIIAVEVWSLISQTIMSLWASLFGDDDDKEEAWDYHKFLRALVVAPLQGWFLAGNLFEGLVRWGVFNEKWFAPQTPMARVTQNIQSGWSRWDDLMTLDPTDPDFRKAFETVMDLIGSVSGPLASAPALLKQVSKMKGAAERFQEE